jgi:hypothetical protein
MGRIAKGVLRAATSPLVLVRPTVLQFERARQHAYAVAR